ncbi:MAG: 50S ribosomal protein L4 [Bdellovibrionales bacterium]|nr:50S ribosomal protein L4 [Bdellovibrionales bacterium]
MATVDVVNWDNKKVGSVELNAEVFEAPVRDEILHQMVRWQLNARRSGTHKAKDRSEVSGGGKKPFKQKGTGNARQGSSRSPLMPGGAVLFGPRPRSYAFKMTKKTKRLGLRTALSYLVSEGRFIVVDSMTSDSGKTKDLVSKLKGLGADKAVLVDSTTDALFDRASQNLAKFRYYSAEGLNVYDLLKFDRAIVTKDSLDAIVSRCGEAK